MNPCTVGCWADEKPCNTCKNVEPPQSISHDEEWARQADAALKRRKEKNIPWEKS